MGKQETTRNRGNEMGESKQRGGLPNAKSNSLKFASQEMKNEVKPQKWIEVRFSGKLRKRMITGSIATNLVKPLGIILPII